MSKYDKTFKEQAVKLAMSSEESIFKIAEELGIKASTFYKWVSIAKKREKKSTSSRTEATQAKEINRLRKENARLKEER